MKIRPSINEPIGFSLLELMIVLVIAGILAMAGSFMLNSAASKLKGAAFRMRGNISLARSEAVNRNTPVLVQFIPGAKDRYLVCIDKDADNDCTDELAADVIRDVTMRKEVQFYDVAGVNGPTYEADGDPLPNTWTANTDPDGIRIGSDTDAAPGDNGNNFLTMLANGMVKSGQDGTIYLYAPEPGAPTKFQAAPIAIDVTPAGRVDLQRWSEKDGTWGTK